MDMVNPADDQKDAEMRRLVSTTFAQLGPQHVTRKPGQDTLVFTLPDFMQQDQVYGMIGACKFPGKVSIIFDNTDAPPRVIPQVQFEGRECLELLVANGVEFNGDSAYRSREIE